MKALLVGLIVLGSLGPTPKFCAHALLLQAQDDFGLPAVQVERKTPPGEWCQRPPVQSKKAHACACHQHNCNDADPNHLSAHVDSQCLNFCTTSQCRCSKDDCP